MADSGYFEGEPLGEEVFFVGDFFGLGAAFFFVGDFVVVIFWATGFLGSAQK